MSEKITVIGEKEAIIEDSDDHFVKITTIKKRKTVTQEIETKPEDYLTKPVQKSLGITSEEAECFAEVLKESGLATIEKVEARIDFEEEKEHELTEEETIEHLMNKIYK